MHMRAHARTRTRARAHTHTDPTTIFFLPYHSLLSPRSPPAAIVVAVQTLGVRAPGIASEFERQE